MPESKITTGIFLAIRPLHDADHGVAVDGRDRDRIHTLVDHRVGDLKLAAVIGLGGRAVPNDLHVQLPRGRHRAGVDRLPVEVRRPIGMTAMRFFSCLPQPQASRTRHTTPAIFFIAFFY